MSLNNTTAIIGARYADVGSVWDQSAAYVFRNLDTATGTVTHNVKLVSSDGAEFDSFGASVGIAGNIGLVGSPFSSGSRGATYVFRNLNTATGTITQNAKLTASDGATGDNFGDSVSISGIVGLIGAYSDDIGSNNNQGSAYVFRNLDAITGTVTENVKLTASDGATNDSFGISVAL